MSTSLIFKFEEVAKTIPTTKVNRAPNNPPDPSSPPDVTGVDCTITLTREFPPPESISLRRSGEILLVGRFRRLSLLVARTFVFVDTSRAMHSEKTTARLVRRFRNWGQRISFLQDSVKEIAHCRPLLWAALGTCGSLSVCHSGTPTALSFLAT